MCLKLQLYLMVVLMNFTIYFSNQDRLHIFVIEFRAPTGLSCRRLYRMLILLDLSLDHLLCILCNLLLGFYAYIKRGVTTSRLLIFLFCCGKL